MSKTFKVSLKIEEDYIDVERVVIQIDDNFYRITADQETGLRIIKYPDTINIQPKVSNDIRLF